MDIQVFVLVFRGFFSLRLHVIFLSHLKGILGYVTIYGFRFIGCLFFLHILCFLSKPYFFPHSRQKAKKTNIQQTFYFPLKKKKKELRCFHLIITIPQFSERFVRDSLPSQQTITYSFLFSHQKVFINLNTQSCLLGTSNSFLYAMQTLTLNSGGTAAYTFSFSMNINMKIKIYPVFKN